MLSFILLTLFDGRCGIVVKSLLWDRRFRVQNLIPVKIRCVCDLLHAKAYVVTNLPSFGVAWKFGEGFQLRCRSRHLTVVHNYEVHPKIARVLFRNGSLI
ncbi:hypothetical protein AVEN_171536-1 [Araneus ventricosus]|uniref:Secreted protein n=1 Tax=Araneus ventricosus TaxID=182803 RepID=A0A4Y2X0X1_ARAVE|nr:hypothetical protein AVEN_95921-1 [Araneus ventricosus]GBO43181.1 hypothetical protein AVEN_171536-1 [Araneus ventricosus]